MTMQALQDLAIFFTGFFGYLLVLVWLREQPWWERLTSAIARLIDRAAGCR